MPLGTVPENVSEEALAFAQQSFVDRPFQQLCNEDAQLKELRASVLKGIVANVKTQPGGFRATSGLVLRYYLNLSTNYMDSAVASLIVRLYSAALLQSILPTLPPSENGAKPIIVGMEAAGGMLVAQLAASENSALRDHFDFLYMRKNRKTTGTAQQLEGPQRFTSRTADSPRLVAVWVDDCNSTGSSLCEGIQTLLEDYNIDVRCALYLVDRSADRVGLEKSRQRLSDPRFVSGDTVIRAIMDLEEVDVLVPKI